MGFGFNAASKCDLEANGVAVVPVHRGDGDDGQGVSEALTILPVVGDLDLDLIAGGHGLHKMLHQAMVSAAMSVALASDCSASKGCR